MSRSVPVIDSVLETHAASLGGDFTAYRNHACRVLHLSAAIAGVDGAGLERLAVAAVFHDLGIWVAGTFDYLEPSAALAAEWLGTHGRADAIDEVVAMIRNHHKVTAWTGRPDWLVEPFRRADWIDVTYGVRRFGLSRSILRALAEEWPDAGFHRRLVQLTLARWRRHPASPLPMVRW